MSDFNALDLDSLDALLDAADYATDDSVKTKEPEPAPVMPEPVVPAPAPEVPLPTSAPAQVAEAKPISKPEPAVVKEPPSIKSGKSSTEETDTAMDSIKKLIIIFSSTLIVLVLTAITLSAVDLFSAAKTDPKVIELLETVKTEVEQSYVLLEDSGKHSKVVSGQLSDIATQMAEFSESIEIMKSKIAANNPSTPTSSKGKSAAERKAALREEIQHNLAVGDAPVEAVVEVEKTANLASSPQVDQLLADMNDVKKRLVETQKVLETMQKQSEVQQLQFQLVTDTLKSVEIDVKALKPVKSAAVPKAPVVKKVEDNSVRSSNEQKPVKPADDPEWRARWSQQMGKSDGFP